MKFKILIILACLSAAIAAFKTERPASSNRAAVTSATVPKTSDASADETVQRKEVAQALDQFRIRQKSLEPIHHQLAELHRQLRSDQARLMTIQAARERLTKQLSKDGGSDYAFHHQDEIEKLNKEELNLTKNRARIGQQLASFVAQIKASN